MKLEAFVPFVTYPEASSDAFAAHAVSFAAKVDARLHAVAINADIPDVSNTLSTWLLDTPALIRRAEAESRRRGEHLLGLLKAKADDQGVEVATAAVAAPIAMLGEVAASRARYFDLSFVGWEANNATSRMTAETVVFGSGRPTILLPELSEVVALDHIAIAWDGSRVAARALADAGFLLRRASRISIITVVDEKPLAEKDTGERLARALRERGLNAESVSINAQDCPIAETLQQAAIEKGAGLLVMGGYGHSRIRDFVLGGATEGVLSDLSMPVLLSH
jgi:nucleotide-binding universal stress UspA family protein